MSFLGWNKGITINGNIDVNNAQQTFRGKDWYQLQFLPSNGSKGYISFANGQFHIDARDSSNDGSDNRTALKIQHTSGSGNNIANAIVMFKNGGTKPGSYRMYGEHNFGKGLSGMGGRDVNTTTDTTMAGFYKFARIKIDNGQWKRTQALFFLCSEDSFYMPMFFYVNLRFNNIASSAKVYLYNYISPFGGSIDANLTNRLYLCLNTPTANDNQEHYVDLFWNQESGYNALKYYLLYGTNRSHNYYYNDQIELYEDRSYAAPMFYKTLTDLQGVYNNVLRLTDVKNSNKTIS